MSENANSVLCLEKLKHLWKSFSSSSVGGHVQAHFDQVFKACDYLLNWQIPQTLKDKDDVSAKKDCPDQGMQNVRKHLEDHAREIGGTQCGEEAVDSIRRTWNKLCNHEGRKREFRTLSNAGACSPFEYEDVSGFPSQLGLDSWLFSYNYPWHVAIWMQRVRDGGVFDDNEHRWFQERDDQAGVKPNGVTRLRFQLKYLWMLSNQNVIPILSLWSFIRLVPIFEELSPTFRNDFGFANGKWSQDGQDFADKWPEISRMLLKALTGEETFSLDEKGSTLRKKLSLMLFASSLAETSSVNLEDMLETGNHAVILYGPPGTGKTYTAQKCVERLLHISDEDKKNLHAEAVQVPAEEDSALQSETIKPIYNNQYGWMSVVQFHPNYTYQDFVGGIFPDAKDGRVVYEKRRGIFQKICKVARTAEVIDEKGKKHYTKRYYLIIDEINRADLSGVFGELMYALEYRNHPIDIPLFSEFSVPENVYIIGTMNNTDKSLIGFDVALRRRFGFLKVMPNMDVLKTSLSIVSHDKESIIEQTGVFAHRANELNLALRRSTSDGGLGLPDDKQIGHAYFLKIKDFCDTESPLSETGDDPSYILTRYALEKLWEYHLEPLLEEYLGLAFQELSAVVRELKKAFCAELPTEKQG